MADDKNKIPFTDTFADEEGESPSTSRARNKTVMLTPEMAGKVRAQITQEPKGKEPASDPVANLLPPMGWNQQQGVQQNKKTQEEPLKTQQGNTMNNQGTMVATPNYASNGIKQIAAKKTKLAAFLISFDNDDCGEVIEIRAGRWLLTSKPTEHGDQIVINDETISPLHAIIRASADGKVQVLDQLSEFGTGIKKNGASKEDEVAGAMVTVEHGDVIRFGKREFLVCTVPNKN